MIQSPADSDLRWASWLRDGFIVLAAIRFILFGA